MRSYVVFLLLLAVKGASRVLFRVRLSWIREAHDPWSDLRVVALLNHTSLFEPLFVAAAPNRMLWQLAAHGVLPVADKTTGRPIVGRLFRFFARHVVPITRERDQTWTTVLSKIRDPRALICILPEGRMKRRTGLDASGNPMTIRGGIADILLAVPGGKLLLAYSGGLHHVHAPGDRFPRPFRRVELRAEAVDIPTYREQLLALVGPDGFKTAVIEDLTRRRDECCPDRARHTTNRLRAASADS
jgi:1-acyl-sn-glycerol-3-phosphate acyltransferase